MLVRAYAGKIRVENANKHSRGFNNMLWLQQHREASEDNTLECRRACQWANYARKSTTTTFCSFPKHKIGDKNEFTGEIIIVCMVFFGIAYLLKYGSLGFEGRV